MKLPHKLPTWTKLLAVALVYANFLLLSEGAFAQDSRLIGNWTLAVSPLSPIPSNAALTIKEYAPSSYGAYPTAAFDLPAPFNGCQAKTSDLLVLLTPKSPTAYGVQLYTYNSSDCSVSFVRYVDVTLSFNSDGSQFSICSADSSCLQWTKAGSTPGQIGKTTVPSPVSAVGGKGSLSVSWSAIPGAYAYRVTISGPINLARTVKTGTFTKFKKLLKGKYKIYYLAFFKDSNNKVATTKKSKAVNLKVK